MFKVTVENMKSCKIESTEFPTLLEAYKFLTEQHATEEGKSRHLLIDIYEGDRKLSNEELDEADDLYLSSLS